MSFEPFQRLSDQPPPDPSPEPQEVHIPAPGPAQVVVDLDTKAVTVHNPDGSVTVNLDGQMPRDMTGADDHDANLAEFIDAAELAVIAADLHEAVSADDRARGDWLETRSEGIKLLGLELKKPQDAVAGGAAPVPGMATVDHPLLLEAVLRFQANARGELLPAEGPVKVRDDEVEIDDTAMDPANVVPAMGAAPPQPPGLGAPPNAPPGGPLPPPGAAPASPPGLAAPSPGQPGPMVPPSPGGGLPAVPTLPMPAMGHNGGPPMFSRDEMCNALEKSMNRYLTVTDKAYVPDTDRMLLMVGAGGCAFKKVYRHPLKRRPVSESVDAKDIIVPQNATDLNNAGRVTHQIMMRPAVLKRMQLAGAYRYIPGVEELPQPTPQPNAVEETMAQTQGLASRPQRPEDADHTIWEIYCELDIKGFEHMEDGEPTGLPLPYIVVLNKDTTEILAIRRNWEEGDDTFTAQIPFVKYPFVPGLGFYDIGLIHILGNTTKAVTAAWREMLDNGMFANFPGFLFLRNALRGQTKTDFRPGPGQGVPIDSSASDIKQAVMPLPYKPLDAAFNQFVDGIAETGARVGGTAEIAVGDGRQDAPVGTTIALMEQATKIVDAVHKRLYAAQAEEFQLLRKLLQKDPEALWRADRKSPLGKRFRDTEDEAERTLMKQAVVEALNDLDIVPAADPNTPSRMHRIMKAVAIFQIAQAQPDLYDMRKVHERLHQMLGTEDYEAMFAAPPPPPQPSPDMQLGVQGELQKTQMLNENKLEIEQIRSEDKAKDREMKLMEKALELVKMAHDSANEAERLGMEHTKTAQAGIAKQAKEAKPPPSRAI